MDRTALASRVPRYSVVMLLAACVLSRMLPAAHGSVTPQRQRQQPRILKTQSTQARHFRDEEPAELNVDARDTYDTSNAALMHSPCRPEKDGFFGSTSSEPIRIQYGFLMEAEPLAKIDKLTDIVQEHLLDQILSHAFPEVCGFRRRRRLSTSGFHFDDIGPAIEPCVPGGNKANYCGVFRGTMSIYGRDIDESTAVEFLTLIDKVLNLSVKDQHDDIVQIMTLNTMFAVTDGSDVAVRSKKNNSVIAFGMFATFAVLLLGLLWFLIFRRRHAQVDGKSSSSTSEASTVSRYRDSEDSQSISSYDSNDGSNSSGRYSSRPRGEGLSPLDDTDEQPPGIFKDDDGFALQKRGRGLV